MEEDQTGSLKFLKTLTKYLFSHVGLCILVALYCVGGAFLFMHIEGEGEDEALTMGMIRSQQIETEREGLAAELWKHKWSPNFNTTVDELLDEYHNNVTAAIDEHGYEGVPIISTDELQYGWAFPSAFLFTLTIVTTIGYGHVTPVTSTGQLVVIFYALIGIPLLLMFLANIGDAMANFFRVAYGRGCCYLCWKQRRKNYEVNRQKIRERKMNRPKSAWSEDGRPRTGASVRSLDPKRDLGPDGMEKGDGYWDGKDKEMSRRGSQADILDDWDESMIVDPDEDIINVPISLTLVIIAAYIFIGAILFSAWNDWSWITGAYFSFVTLSTIGFGDLVPGWSEVGSTTGNLKLVVSNVYIILGLAVLSMSFNLMMEEMIAKFKWLGRKLGIVDDHSMQSAPPPIIEHDKAPLMENDQFMHDPNMSPDDYVPPNSSDLPQIHQQPY